MLNIVQLHYSFLIAIIYILYLLVAPTKIKFKCTYKNMALVSQNMK